MSAPHPLILTLNEPPRLARVSWRIDGRTGHGSWLDEAAVRAIVDTMNRQYGAGTHWVEVKP
jgi:hypothetical protein